MAVQHAYCAVVSQLPERNCLDGPGSLAGHQAREEQTCVQAILDQWDELLVGPREKRMWRRCPGPSGAVRDEMDSSSFYGKRGLRTRLPPEDKSDDSCLTDSEDDVVPYHHTQARVSSSSSEDEDKDAVDEPSASRKRAVRWKKTGCQEQREVPPWESPLPEADTVRAPIEYFKDFFDDNFMDHIFEQSNVFATQKNSNKRLALSRDELDRFLGTVTFMSICRLPRSRLYWAAESRVPTVADMMPRDRWEAIKANLHFNNNDDMPPPNDPHKDRLFKVRPVIDFLLPKFQGIPKTQAMCIDERMVPFKGRSSLKQYIPSKPHKWGYKVFLLCDPQGMVHSFEIYTV
ncbi:hypothetical protein HPB51_016326 [Rhipicephalus microplus]|uniref:PiggyBac transposable element-derived protein domain-containing protein n=1 Tax=Rhipicephalus microplus TaxID=6941 RepID=A0A9J6ENS6_RHIMP|nr:hypothetical protein HPB51_016326 [Rhipicephalus microplus]